MKAVYLKHCVHIFDSIQQKFVKLNATNLHSALNLKEASLTRREMKRIILSNPDKFKR